MSTTEEKIKGILKDRGIGHNLKTKMAQARPVQAQMLPEIV